MVWLLVRVYGLFCQTKLLKLYTLYNNCKLKYCHNANFDDGKAFDHHQAYNVISALNITIIYYLTKSELSIYTLYKGNYQNLLNCLYLCVKAQGNFISSTSPYLILKLVINIVLWTKGSRHESISCPHTECS